MAVGASVEAPPGRLDAIPSVGGGVLRYFTPDPLPDLLTRCQAWSRAQKKETTAETPAAMAMPFARMAAIRSRGMVDESQAQRLIAQILRSERIRKREDVFALAQDLGIPASLRAEIIFSGGSTSSTATHVYAPYPALPSLIDSLMDGLTEEFEDLDATTRAAALGFFCVHVHPFKDGNGRWSRLVMAADASHGSEFKAIVGAAFQSVCKAELCNSVWPRARTSGLATYLELARAFERAVTIAATDQGLLRAAEQLDRELRKLLRPSQVTVAASELWGKNTLALEWLRTKAGVSKKVIDGFVARTLEFGKDFFAVRGGDLSVEGMSQKVIEVLTSARASTFKEIA